MLTRSTAIALVAAGALATAGAAWAQTDYPNRAVRVLVPFAPGGAPDLVGRLLSTRLSDRLGQPFVVENRTGAGGNIATDAVAKAAADGYTLLAGSDGPLVISPHIYAKLPYDPVKDFVHVSIAANVGFGLFACTTLPANTLGELVALAKSKPGKLSYASSGIGTNHHLAGEMLKAAAGLDITHIPYKGFGQGVIDVVGCKVDFLFGAISSGMPHVRSGKLKMLGAAMAARYPGAPDVPTFTEAGLRGFEMEAYFGLLAPAGTPRAIVDKLQAEVAAIVMEKETAERLNGAGLTPVGSTPEEFTRRVASDLTRYASVAKAAGIRAE
jgi:tripartite-type tricarboxylate transporter receptor subunit TctC